jgi:hypothetical protein
MQTEGERQQESSTRSRTVQLNWKKPEVRSEVCGVVTETFGVLSLFGVMQCYSYSKIKSVIINCNSAWRIPNKSSIKYRTHKLYVALPGKCDIWCQKWADFVRLLELRSYCIVTPFYYGDATNNQNAGRNEGKPKWTPNRRRQPNEEMWAEIIARMTINLKEMGADRKRDQEDLKGIMEEMNARVDNNQAEMRSTVCALRSEFKETVLHEMKAVIQAIQSELDEMTACNKATD